MENLLGFIKEHPELVVLLSFIIAIISILITIYSIFYSKSIAKRQGTFKVSKIKILFDDIEDVSEIIFALPLPIKGIVKLPFEFMLKNVGDTFSKDVRLSVNIPELLLFPSHVNIYKANAPEFHEIKYHLSQGTDLAQNNKLKKITIFHEKLEIQDIRTYPQVIELVVSNETMTSFKTIIPFDDNVELPMEIQMYYSYELDFFLTADNNKTIWKRILVSVANTANKSIQDYFEARDKLIQKEYETNNFSLFKKLKSPKGDNILIRRCSEEDMIKISSQENDLEIYGIKNFNNAIGKKIDRYGYWIPALEAGFTYHQ